MRKRCAPDHPEHGANAVEFALVLPILVMLLFGTMYGASLFNSYQTVTQAAREGARYGALLPRDNDWSRQVEARAMAVLGVDRPLTPGPVSVCVRFYPDGGAPVHNGATACSEPSTISSTGGERVEVVVTRVARLEFGMGSIGPIKLLGAAVGRYEVSS
jgi:hypothetical protein